MLQQCVALTYTHAYVYAIAKMQGIYYFITLLHVSFLSLFLSLSVFLILARYVSILWMRRLLSHVPSAHAVQ